MVKVGDSIPSIELVEGKPDAKVDLSKEFGSGLIIGVPAAFSMLTFPVKNCGGSS
jgi:2-Cys peroxiredoxin 5